ncbi:MAG: T9SS type A sorting domain-containing protein, partial [Ferruginibacter sp.]
KQVAAFGTAKKVHEFLITSPTSDAAATVVFDLQESSGVTYLDDIEFYETNASLINNNDKISFEYNASKSSRTVPLYATYIDLDGKPFEGSNTLQPYCSALLLKSGELASNKAPVAKADTDKVITLPINYTTLTGTGTDTDGSISSYAWVKISGPATGTIATPTAANSVLNNLSPGIYKFELTVTDNRSATGRDTIQVTVNAANIAPRANAGIDIVITLPANSNTLTGSGTDTDGTISSYAWVKISGPVSGTIATPATANPVVNNLVQGIYKFELTVTDNKSATGRDTIQVTVNAALNVAPRGNAGTDQIITLPINNTTLTGTATDTDGTISSYAWVKISGPVSGTIATPATANPVVNNLVQGIYKFELTVTDNKSATGRDTIQVTVNAALNVAPRGNAGTDQIITLPINNTTLTGTATDTDGTISSYAWVKISGPVSGTIATPATANPVVNNLVQGIYKFELIVTDNMSATGRDTIQVTVIPATNIAPQGNAGNNQIISLPANIATLTGTGTDIDGTISSYSWVKISGPASGTIVTPSGALTAVTNLTQGNYQFELTVIDNNNATGKDTMEISVIAAANKAPVANAGTDSSIVIPANSISLTGSALDTDGTISSYSWRKISGPDSGAIQTPAAAVTMVSNLVPGVYKFELTVTDNNNATGSDTIQVMVNEAAISALLANAGSDVIINAPLNRATLRGTAAYKSGTIKSYAWSKLSGPSSGKILTPAYSTTLLYKLVQGTYQFELEVTDDNGAIGKDTVKVIVNRASKHAPIIKSLRNRTISLPLNTITLSGVISTDTTISSIGWTKISGPASGTITTANSSVTSVNNLEKGIYKYELTVTDSDGAIGKDTVEVTVNAARFNELDGNKEFGVVKNELKVYPNPVIDVANVAIVSAGTKKLSVSVSDMRGRLVKYTELSNVGLNKTFTVDMAGLQDGSYIITVRFDNGQILNSKVLKTKGR